MKNAVEIFAALGERLRDFGTDAVSRRVVEEACRANGWFSPDEIVRSVGAIRTEMLDPGRLSAWLARYPLPVAAPKRVLVVMAGNIPLVGFFDLLCVLAAGHACVVKPSGKDTALVEYVVASLRAIEPHLPVSIGGDSPVDAVIATGSDNAARYFRAHYAGLPSLLRGSRQSVAVLSGGETPEQLAGLADDIWTYSGLGCRNVSLVFCPEGYELRLTMPAVNEKYRNNYRQRRALCEMTGRPFRDLGAALAVEHRGFPTALSELSVARYRTPEEVAAWLAEHDREVQCVVTEMLPHPRQTEFGRAQSPGLTDWPDGRDVLAWLADPGRTGRPRTA